MAFINGNIKQNIFRIDQQIVQSSFSEFSANKMITLSLIQGS